MNRGGEACPPALQLLACGLLWEVTAFMRETYQFLPRSRGPGVGGHGGSGHGKPHGWDRLMSHRRW